MAVRTVVLRSLRVSIEEETTEGTPVAETANGAMVVSGAGAEFKIPRDYLQSNGLTGSFTKSAGVAGMYGDDMGVILPARFRGVGTLGANGPDWQMPAKSAFGSEYRMEAGVVDAGATAITIPVKSGAASPVVKAGLLLYFPTQGEVRRVSAYSAPNITLETPLSSIPSEDDTFISTVCWLLTSSPDHPIATVYGYYGESQDMRIRMTSCKTSQMKFTAKVGGYCDLVFTMLAMEPLQDNTAQAITPAYDNTTEEIVCLGVDGFGKVSGVITGVPTTTETVLLAPNYDVRVGDYIIVDVGSSVWETKLISAVSGNAPGNLTLTHAALSGAGTATETCYILRTVCAEYGETLDITMDCPVKSKKCMGATYGKSGLASVDRNITIAAEPYFESWEQFLMRDNAVGMGMLAVFGDVDNDDQGNIVALYISKKVVTDVSINNNDIMTQSVSSMATKDATLGDEYEFVMAAF